MVKIVIFLLGVLFLAASYYLYLYASNEMESSYEVVRPDLFERRFDDDLENLIRDGIIKVHKVKSANSNFILSRIMLVFGLFLVGLSLFV